jgi:flavin-dependent dehydrogenase
LKDSYDVVVVGGGPAGSATAALLAEHGRSVLLAERERFPRFHIGESLMPATYWPLQRLGVLEQMKRSAFPRKHSVQFYNHAGKASHPFYFSETNPHESAVTWQVLRSDFDALLLDNVRAKGGEVVQGTRVREVLFDGERAVGVELADSEPGSGPRRVAARVVVDATGGDMLMARRKRLAQHDPVLSKASIFTHFAGALRDPGIDEGATLVLDTDDQLGWFWYIPLPHDVVSVGVVGNIDYLISGRGGDPQRTFEEEVARCVALQPRLENARQLWPVKVLRDFSWRTRQIAGDGWAVVGDALGFLDPIYSSGVLIALKSGELAADAIHDALAAGEPTGERLGRYGPEVLSGMEALRKLVYAFYTRDFSFARFLRQYPHRRNEIVDLLTGDVFGGRSFDALFEEMATMCELPGEWPSQPVATAPVAAGAAARPA